MLTSPDRPAQPAPSAEQSAIGPGRPRSNRSRVGRVRGGRRRYQPHHYLLMVMGWPVVAASTALLYLRWQEVDRVYLIAAVALTPFLAGALLPASVIAWFSRSTLLRLATAAVVAVYLYTVAPLDAVIDCGPELSERAITIMTANVQVEGGDPVGIADQVSALNPDVLFLQESSRGFLEVLGRQPELEPWAYRSNQEPGASAGVTVWSKWPMSDMRFATLDMERSLEATVALPDGNIGVVAVHTISPTDRRGVGRWNEQLTALARHRFDRPTIMAGDFNATEDHAPFRNLLNQGWTDSHDDKGCGLDQTWPTTTMPFPVMRLDHILVSDDFDVLSNEIVKIEGSDHLAVVARVEPID
ncbi:MAG: endonuclease/exonuclease/phosphatase family protein [Acidimicrobiia bacterium]|nr:endonuclease/exonuclease/phosphatase family protein [Acidimicrobiia bacterium]